MRGGHDEGRAARHQGGLARSVDVAEERHASLARQAEGVVPGQHQLHHVLLAHSGERGEQVG